MQLVPHYVSWPIEPDIADEYSKLTREVARDVLNGDDPLFRTFNLDALTGLAHVIGHWGNCY
jgi:hypothetical protein